MVTTPIVDLPSLLLFIISSGVCLMCVYAEGKKSTVIHLSSQQRERRRRLLHLEGRRTRCPQGMSNCFCAVWEYISAHLSLPPSLLSLITTLFTFFPLLNFKLRTVGSVSYQRQTYHARATRFVIMKRQLNLKAKYYVYKCR